MEAWAELSEPNDAGSMGLTSGSGTRFQNLAMAGGVGHTNSAGTDDKAVVCRVPLQFWFNRNPGLALPLIALQYHEVKISITLGKPTGVSLTAQKVYNFGLTTSILILMNVDASLKYRMNT